eukprot:scaffold96675_cov27-Cyclotella_meneghiniana.AAC.1
MKPGQPRMGLKEQNGIVMMMGLWIVVYACQQNGKINSERGVRRAQPAPTYYHIPATRYLDHRLYPILAMIPAGR